ncbi:MAG: ABC transporter ATP-binding protein [Pseudomonadota bacterium]
MSSGPMMFHYGGRAAEEPQVRRSPRQLARLLKDAVSLVWRAAPREFGLAGSLQVLAGLGAAAELLLAQRVLNELLAAETGDGDFSDALVPGLLFLGLLLLLTAAQVFQREYQRLLAELTRREAQEQILAVATEVELEAFETPSFLDRFQRAQVQGQFRPLQIANALLTMISGVVGLLAVAGVLLALQPALMLVLLLAFVPLWLASTRNSRAFYRFFWKRTQLERRLAYLWHLMTGKDPAKELRAFDLGPYLLAEHRALYDERLGELRDLVRRRTRISLLANLASPAFLGGAMIYLLLSGRLSLAQVAIAAWGVYQFGQRLEGIALGAGSLYESALFIEDFSSFAAMKPEVIASRPTGAAPSRVSRIEVEGRSFANPGTVRLAQRDVSLSIDAGQVVALVGENGSGKTTLAKLLCRLYRPTGGRILWDGEDIAEMDPTAIRDAVAVIFQDFLHYEFPARANVAMGRVARADDTEAIVAAAKRAGAHDFIDALPQGYETLLSRQFHDEGKELSVGQWQLIALARAFFRDAQLLVLDEPTAALDARAEHALFERIRELAQGRSVLLISHRFSSVRDADRIFVLRHGELVEQGDHRELMALGGLYAELFDLQARAYVDAAASAAAAPDVTDRFVVRRPL